MIQLENDQAELHDPNKENIKSNGTKTPKVSNKNIFDYFAKVYVNYIQILDRLEICFDAIIQPQKRLDIKASLELVISRVVEIKHQLVKFNEHSFEGKSHENVPLSKEQNKEKKVDMVGLDPMLRSLKISPDNLEIPIPRFYKEEDKEYRAQRNALVEGYMKLKLGQDHVKFERIVDLDTNTGNKQEDDTFLELGDNDGPISKNKWLEESFDENGIDFETDDFAAVAIQKIVRGVLSRKKTKSCQEEERILLGMRHEDRKKMEVVEKNLQDTYTLRKKEQAENQEKYEEALISLKDVVFDEEGFEIREKLREERTRWITDQIAETNTIPESIDGFYTKDLPTDTITEEKEDKGKKSDNKGKDGKGAKDETETDEKPEIAWKSAITALMNIDIESFDSHWEHRQEPEYNREKHDTNMAKDRLIRANVESELAQSVDQMLLMNLKHIKEMHEEKKKRGKGKKGGKKKGKGKKGKGKGKGKKEKPLPGAKIAELKNMDCEEMLSILVEHRIINNVRKDIKINDFLGDNFVMRSLFMKSEADIETDKFSSWINPSMAKLRSLVTEYCILPLGSKNVKGNLNEEDNIRSMLFFGPEGSGKSFMAEIIAAELGALLINLSPDRLKGVFNNKVGPTKLIHMIFTVAKNLSYSPIVIYMDDCEQFFLPLGKKKKGPVVDKNGPVRFQKDLLTYKNRCITNDDRVIIIGASKNPEMADMKTFKWKGPNGKPEKQGFFEKFISFPFPNYSDRRIQWKKIIQHRLAEYGDYSIVDLDTFNFSALAHISEGQTPGSIKKYVQQVLTRDRIEKLQERPLNEDEFRALMEPVDQKEEQEEVQGYEEELRRHSEFIYRIAEMNSSQKESGDAGSNANKGKSGSGDKKSAKK